ncbi:hypothetical protein EON81_04095 [bacterium]|nr:MAG: hypothetical protein EON81_04095 [bacterium]
MTEREVAERVLREAWSGDVRLALAETYREGRCFLFRVEAAPPGHPPTVIVKRAIDQDGFVADPDSPDRNPAHALLDEWASLAFLVEVAPDAGLAPRFYGGDRDTCLIVYEDLGSGPSLVEPLMGTDPEAARAALRGHAETVARLHNATTGREVRFEQIRRELGPPVHRRGGMGWGDLDALKPDMAEGFAALGITAESGFWDDYRAMAEAIAQPGPFRSLVHNDSCPDNCRLTETGVRLFDFEVGGFHHRLLDAAYARMSMPHCYLSNAVPPEVVRETEETYRQFALLTAPEMADGSRFRREMAHACFYWVVSNGIWQLRDRFDGDDFTWGIATWRQRVFHRLEALADLCDEAETMPAVAKAARETTARLHERWTVEPLPLYPAFRRE